MARRTTKRAKGHRESADAAGAFIAAGALLARAWRAPEGVARRRRTRARKKTEMTTSASAGAFVMPIRPGAPLGARRRER
jgi:hypothetical protein